MVLLVVIAVAAKFTVTTINKPEKKFMGTLCIAWILMLLEFLILSLKQTSSKKAFLLNPQYKFCNQLHIHNKHSISVL